MLISGMTLLLVASVIGGWCFMCDTLPLPPQLAQSPVPLLMAILIALTGIVLLFVAKWYAGLIGIVGVVGGFNLFAAVWHYVYQVFRL